MSNEELYDAITKLLNLKLDPIITILIIAAIVFLVPTAINVFIAFRLKRKDVRNAALIRKSEIKIEFYRDLYKKVVSIRQDLYDDAIKCLPNIKELRLFMTENGILLSRKAFTAVDNFCDSVTIAATERSKRNIEDEDRYESIIKNEFGKL